MSFQDLPPGLKYQLVKIKCYSLSLKYQIRAGRKQEVQKGVLPNPQNYRPHIYNLSYFLEVN